MTSIAWPPISYQLRLLEPVLLLLLVEYRADAAVVGMLGIPVQLRHILLLFVFVANYQHSLTNIGFCLWLVILIFPSKNTREFLSNLHPVTTFTLVNIIRDGFGDLIKIVLSNQQSMTYQLRHPAILTKPFRSAN